MPNLDRFSPPYEVDTESCASCKAPGFTEDMLYDERSESFFCRKDCYLEWADAKFEQISEYYYVANID